mmetsp:Transcript_37423/g.94952  ORF Transcript_37423/g.94952 Transcript_37423/m.94952 type:complete len:249 (+) Transcript_37423:179-925(+)
MQSSRLARLLVLVGLRILLCVVEAAVVVRGLRRSGQHALVPLEHRELLCGDAGEQLVLVCEEVALVAVPRAVVRVGVERGTFRHGLEHGIERRVRLRCGHETHLLVVDWLLLVLLLRRRIRLAASPLPLHAVGGAAALAQRLRHLADVLLRIELHVQARVREVAGVARDGVHRDRLVGEREVLHALLPVGRHPHHARRRDHQRATCLDGGLSDEDPHGTGVGGCLALLEHDVCALCAGVHPGDGTGRR